LGNPTGFHLTPGHAYDLHGADVLLPGVLEKIDALLADNAFDANERVLDLLKQAGVERVIPPKSSRIEQREYDKDLYKTRHLIENFFAKLKHYRAIATRYAKRARNFASLMYLVSSMLWMK